MQKKRKNMPNKQPPETGRPKNKNACAYGEVSRFVLGMAGATAIVAVAALMPGLAHVAAPFIKREEREQRKLLRLTLKRLSRRGLIATYARADGREVIALTQKGKQELARLELCGLRPPKKQKWDGKWRLVMFDVSEKRKYLRDRIRAILRQAGFQRLQDSAWIYPFECEEIIETVRTGLRLREDAIYLTCERFPGDKKILAAFSLRA